MLLPQGIFAQSIATAIFPTFAAQVAAGEVTQLRHSFGQIIRTILFLTIPAAVGLYLLRTPLIALLLQRREFTAESTALVAYALQFYAIGLVAHSLVEITVRAFYALHDTWTPVVVGIGAMALNIALSFWWVGSLQHGGLALANSTATTLEMVLLLWLLRNRIGGLDGRRLLLATGRHLVAAGAMALAVMGVLSWVQPHQPQEFWLTVLIGLPLAALVYGGSALVLRCEELAPLLGLVRRRLHT
jgi:putative peptidoglycan lipid II flippase